MNELPNMHRVSSGVYIVRTQAGFRKALKTYLGEDNKEQRKDLVGYPSSYPSMVFFYMDYRGYHYPVARCVPLNDLRAALLVADPTGERS